jgi:hypothetical protein
VYVIDMPLEIAVVANQMLPIATLPDAALTSFHAAFGPSFADGDLAREPRLDQSPSLHVIRIMGVITVFDGLLRTLAEGFLGSMLRANCVVGGAPPESRPV